METVIDRVRDHYEADSNAGTDIIAKLSAILADMDGDITTAQVAGIDQFHVGGLAATMELGRRLELKPAMTVLDAGSGLGGPSRAFAETYGCTVTGIDLSPRFIAVAELLAGRTNLGSKVQYHVGDLTVLPFADALFDAAYTQHVVMNIADRGAVYRELRRVLKPGARFGFYDVLASDQKPAPHFPVPWAADATTSFLLTETETRSELEAAGFAVTDWSDVTMSAMGWAAQQQAAGATQPANLGMIMGPRMSEMAANLMRNLGEARLKLVMAVCAAI